MKKQALPLISIFMPVLQGSPILAEAIESILKQTHERIELFILQGQVDKKTVRMIQNYKHRKPRIIKIIPLAKSITPFDGINTLIPKTHGSFIAFTNGQTKSDPKRLEKQLTYLTDHPETILVGSFAKQTNAQGHTIKLTRGPTTPKGIYNTLALTNPINASSVLVRKSLLPIPLFHPNIAGKQSFYYALFELLAIGKFANVPEYLITQVGAKELTLVQKRMVLAQSIRLRAKAMRNYDYVFPMIAFPILFLQYVGSMLIPTAIYATIDTVARGLQALRAPKRRRRKLPARRRIYALPFS